MGGLVQIYILGSLGPVGVLAQIYNLGSLRTCGGAGTDIYI